MCQCQCGEESSSHPLFPFYILIIMILCMRTEMSMGVRGFFQPLYLNRSETLD